MDELFMAAKVCRVARVMHRTWSRSRKENRGKFAGFCPAAVVESGDGTQGRFWTRLDPL